MSRHPRCTMKRADLDTTDDQLDAYLAHLCDCAIHRGIEDQRVALMDRLMGPVGGADETIDIPTPRPASPPSRWRLAVRPLFAMAVVLAGVVVGSRYSGDGGQGESLATCSETATLFEVSQTVACRAQRRDELFSEAEQWVLDPRPARCVDLTSCIDRFTHDKEALLTRGELAVFLRRAAREYHDYLEFPKQRGHELIARIAAANTLLPRAFEMAEGSTDSAVRSAQDRLYAAVRRAIEVMEADDFRRVMRDDDKHGARPALARFALERHGDREVASFNASWRSASGSRGG